MYSSKGETYDISRVPLITMYNEYFGGGMSAIVFQEMREARGLAYSAGASYRAPTKLDDVYSFSTFIGTQADKMDDAVQAFFQIINDMPQSEKAFDIAKQSVLSNIRTQRTSKNALL
jgi:predicted Zn-dependent peptidase